MEQYPSFIAKNGIENGSAISIRLEEYSPGSGFLSNSALNHGDDSEASDNRHNGNGNDEVAITRRVSHKEEQPTKKEHKSIGYAQNYGDPSQILQPQNRHYHSWG